ncbi:MAG: beta-ketoacyl-ACP synthase III [Acidimicrobiales bacterium]
MTDPSRGAAAITGIGAYRPRRIVPNEEICEHIDSTDEWIRSRTGIVTRRWADADETLSFMAAAAATEALRSAGVEPAAVGLIMVASCSNGQPVQPLAARVAAALGTEVAALEINATCAGFCYGLSLARDVVRGGTAEHVLVIGAERLTDLLDHEDRGTAFIFADGAGAFVVSRSEREGVGPVTWGSDGDRGDALVLAPDWVEHRADPSLGLPSISMEGRRIFKWAAEAMPKVAEAACKAAGITIADIDVFVPHQANQRITDMLVKGLDLPPSVVVGDDIVVSGNTSSASVPLATHRLLADGRAKSGDCALLVGFGGGLAYAAQVVTLP